jgi:hypothetical protein
MALEDTVVVLVPWRSARDISESMTRRGNRGTHAQFYDLTRMYNKRLMTALIAYNIIFKTVEFRDLIYKTKDVAKDISKFLSYPITDTTFVDPKISKVA